ncbi:leucine-rich repeat domain-containing protein [Caproicibacter fermentans]|uniref:Leucine-rich repeat domain-containing protein n=1 Tax=Caproicibacter fermentans TaxID=2576756 RepID=A0A7G8T6Q9_9FIRM|nr:leucine-rich repeat domain-containing protein [Caproicibacter fermentans]QNK39300.1 leucine-rich repeat domain-containing protein [Caproicibacter fermentans]
MAAFLIFLSTGCDKISIPTRFSPPRASSAASGSAPGASSSASSAAPSSESLDTVIPNDDSGIPDKAFYKAVLETKRQDGKTPVDENGDGKLQAGEARAVPYAAHWERKGIRSVQGVEYLSAVEIHLEHNKVSDLSPLVKRARAAAKSDLISVYLNGNRVTGLYSLTAPMLLLNSAGLLFDHLDLSDNEITDLSPLGLLKITGIKYLNLSHNKIAGIDALSGAMFEVLDLSYNRIEKVGALHTDVIYLDLSHNRIASVQSLSGKFLTQLYLSDNALTDLDFLRDIPGEGTSGKGLLCLDASDNRLASLPDFKGWGWTNLSPEKQDGAYQVDFRGNRLAEKELKSKLPEAFLTAKGAEEDGAKWLKEQVGSQKTE